MPIDPAKARGAEPRVRHIAWTSRDVLLYHLSLGAGADRDRGLELPYTYERQLHVLPTFAMVAGSGLSAERAEEGGGGSALPGIDVEPRAMLHAGQELRVHRPLPSSGSAVLRTRVVDVFDKGKAAMIVVATDAADAEGVALWTATMRIWVRGEGGFGGEPGPSERREPPERAPDAVWDLPTLPQQALLYRLNGDLNPLHADPEVARAVGFEAPILHGLASYGIVAKALVDRLFDGDAGRLGALGVRFAGTLWPGETLRTRVWQQEGGLVLQATCPERDEAPVLTQATAEEAA